MDKIKVKVRSKPQQKVTIKPLVADMQSYDAELLKIYLQAKEDVKNGN